MRSELEKALALVLDLAEENLPDGQPSKERFIQLDAIEKVRDEIWKPLQRTDSFLEEFTR